jgi:vesicle-fusing ATPase
VLIIDEIDALLPRRDRDTSSSGVRQTLVNQFLSEFDGLTQFNNFICIGTTNCIDLIDRAILRSGRFSVKLEFVLPDLKSRVDIFNIHLKKLVEIDRLEPVNVEELATLTDKLSGADIEKIVADASMMSLQRMMHDPNRTISKITADDLRQCIEKMRPKENTTHLAMYT